MHTTWANDPVNSPNHYTRSHPGMECIELTADTSFCLGNAIKYLWRYHSKGRPVEDLEKARWYLCHVIDHDICPDCAQRFNDQTIGTVHIRRDHRDKLSPYLLEYQPTDPKEDQA